jgi:hypothetical protein
MAPRRTHGNTACLFVGVTAVDVPSTLKLELMARWDEALDNGVDAPSRQSYATLAYRRDVATDEKDPTFIDRPWSWNLGDDHPGGNYLLPFHEFRDTRHRRVSYRTVATSRYAEYFGPGDPGDAGRFTQVSEASTLEIPASARPAAPKVLRIVPSFRWDEQVDAQGVRTRTRRAGVRVVMDRPWYSSGDGEQLGVMLLAADPNPSPPPPPPDPGPEPGPGPLPFAVLSGPIAPAVAPLVTQWGNDPTVVVGPDLPAPLMPTPAQFGNGVAVAYGQWFADIDIDPGAADLPFIRFALVRFQANAVVDSDGDQRVSNVVLADCLQLAPGRSVSIVADTADASAVRLTLDGAAFGTDAAMRWSATVQADCGSAQAPLWLEFGETALVPRMPTRLSLPFARGTRPMRVVVREFERRRADALARADITQDRGVERLIYADVIHISIGA